MSFVFDKGRVIDKNSEEFEEIAKQITPIHLVKQFSVSTNRITANRESNKRRRYESIEKL